MYKNRCIFGRLRKSLAFILVFSVLVSLFGAEVVIADPGDPQNTRQEVIELIPSQDIHIIGKNTDTINILTGEGYEFVIENVSMNVDAGITARATVTPIIPGGRNAVVIFKLMQGDTVLGLYSGEFPISGSVNTRVKFHGYSGDQYKVKVYVWDKLDDSIDSIGVDLAPPVEATLPAIPTVTPEPTQTPSPTPTGIPDPAAKPTKLTYPDDRLSLTCGTFYGPRIPTVEGGTPTIFEVSPALPDGISFDPNTGVLCGGNTKPTGISGLKYYTITAKNDAGSASFVIAIEVKPIITFTADPLSILKGEKTTLTWQVQKVENIGYPAPVVTISNLGVQSRTGSVEVSPEQTTTYSLSVQSGEEYFPDVKTITIQVGDDSMLPTPVINVIPSTTVEVGEAVIFDGRGSLDDKPLLGDDCLVNTFVWDYGDGSDVMSQNWGHRSGPVSLHYFMEPGTFPVTLTVNDNDGYKASTTVNITVTGTAPMDGFEVLHAPFHSRIAQKILVHLPGSVTADSANRMIATLQGPQGGTTLLSKSGLSVEEEFLLDHRNLAKGDYVLEVELLNGNGQRLPGGIWREKFTKDYDGLPTVGIDENNAICVNGELYFPVHNWLMNLASLPDYLSMKAMDGTFYLYTEQKARYDQELGRYIPDLDVLKNTFQSYLEPNGLFGIVEDNWPGKGKTEASLRNSDPDNIREYVAGLKDSPSLFAWCWDDEPNLGSWTSGGITPNVLAAWHYFTSFDDPNHPTLTNLAGYMYCSTAASNKQKIEYMMMYSDKGLGKKAALADIIHGACFALEAYKSYPDPNDPSRGAVDVYTDYLKNRRDMNYNLLPTMAVVAPCNIIPNDKLRYFGPPSPDEIRMMSWLNIVYGVKGMNWYPYLGYVPAENFATMGEISQQIDELTPVILGPEEVPGISVSDNANVKGNKVETMLRETDDAYYLFTVRLTEREWWDDPSIEPEEISVTFELEGLSGSITATEYLNHKKVSEEHGTEEGGTEFTFTLAQKPVPGSVSFGGVIEQNDTPYKKYCYVFDDGNGNLYANKYWKTGGTIPAGTIDYSTGEVTVFFPNMWNQKKEQILPGEDCLIVSYEPVRTERTILIQNGSFIDTFKRNDVHIYRIPKN